MYLNCHSYYSLRYGTMSVERLVEMASCTGVKHMALTDINNTTGIPDFVMECRNHGITPAAGIEFRVGDMLLYIGIARNNEGFRELNAFLSHSNISGEPLPFPAPSFMNAYVVYPLENSIKLTLRENEFIGIKPYESSRLISLPKVIIAKCVVLSPVTIAYAVEYNTHRCLRAIDKNTLLSHLRPSEMATPDEVFVPESSLKDCFSLFPGIIENTRRILSDCSLDIDFSTSKNKKIYSASRYDDKL
ncbi:MAG TPA: PHP domain-containing protein, partial [Bacteroidales bacterium]|nr:PHP domain-containing protein [Bacteroidales bacterium]